MNHASQCVRVPAQACSCCLTNVCVSHKLQCQWLDWCNDSSNVKYSSGDCRGGKDYKCMYKVHKVQSVHRATASSAFSSLCFEAWRSARQTRADWKLLDSHLPFKQIFLPSICFLQASFWCSKQTKQNKTEVARTSPPTEPNPANQVWVSRFLFHFLSSH